MIRVMGIDLSLTSTGYSSEETRGHIPARSKGVERLDEISKRIMTLITEHNIKAVAIEGYSFASRNSHAHSIGELGGVMRLRLWENGIPFVEIPPTSRAKFATGKGNAAKTEVMSSISAKTGIVFSGAGADDMCDAFVLEEMIRCKLGMPRYAWNQIQSSSLDKVDWSPIASIITNTQEMK